MELKTPSTWVIFPTKTPVWSMKVILLQLSLRKTLPKTSTFNLKTKWELLKHAWHRLKMKITKKKLKPFKSLLRSRENQCTLILVQQCFRAKEYAINKSITWSVNSRFNTFMKLCFWLRYKSYFVLVSYLLSIKT